MVKELDKELKDEDKEFEIQEEVNRDGLTLQNFFKDMQMLGNQTKNNDIAKPFFQYGSLEVTNYLLWLVLGELMILNNKKEEE